MKLEPINPLGLKDVVEYIGHVERMKQLRAEFELWDFDAPTRANAFEEIGEPNVVPGEFYAAVLQVLVQAKPGAFKDALCSVAFEEEMTKKKKEDEAAERASVVPREH